jgi:hypothetical protein
MTQDKIIEMARQAGMAYEDNTDRYIANIDDLLDFTKLVAAKEREACAKICDEFCYGNTKILVEKAIRARGEA